MNTSLADLILQLLAQSQNSQGLSIPIGESLPKSFLISTADRQSQKSPKSVGCSSVILGIAALTVINAEMHPALKWRPTMRSPLCRCDDSCVQGTIHQQPHQLDTLPTTFCWSIIVVAVDLGVFVMKGILRRCIKFLAIRRFLSFIPQLDPPPLWMQSANRHRISII